MHLQGISAFGEKYRAEIWQTESTRSPLVTFRIAEKRRLRAFGFRQSSPRCVVVSLQKLIFTDLDLPEMHFCPARSVKASHWNEMHLGEVQIGKTHALSRYHDASRGAVTKQMCEISQWVPKSGLPAGQPIICLDALTSLENVLIVLGCLLVIHCILFYG